MSIVDEALGTEKKSIVDEALDTPQQDMGLVAKLARAVDPYTKYALPMAGAIGGGVLAAPANIVAPGVAEAGGVALGTLAGQQAANYIGAKAGRVKGGVDSQRLAQEIPEAGINAVAGPVLNKALPVIAKTVGKVGNQILGMTTGAGPYATEQAVKGGPAFTKALRGETTGDEVVETAKNALRTIVDKRSSDYRNLLSTITKDKTPIDLTEIKTKVTDNLKNFVKYREASTITPTVAKQNLKQVQVVQYPHGGGYALKDAQGKYITMKSGHAQYYKDEATAQGMADYMMKSTVTKPATPETIPAQFNWSRTSVGDVKDSKDAKELKKIYDKIQNWGTQPGDNTAIELDRLKRELDNHWSDSSRVRAFVANARDTVNSAIKKNVPEYGEMTKGYSEATKLIKDFESGLMLRKNGMSGRIVADQTLKRLTSAMREGSELRNDLLKVLGSNSGNDLNGMVAGYSMNQSIPRGLVGKIGAGGALAALNPKMWPLVAASSPRVVGEFLMALGKIKPNASAVSSILKPLIYGATANTQQDTEELIRRMGTL